MKKLKTIFIISAFSLFFLSQKNGFSQDSISYNQIDADINSSIGTNITAPNDVLSNMLLPTDKDETIITEQNNTSNTPSDSVNVFPDFILSTEKDPQNN